MDSKLMILSIIGLLLLAGCTTGGDDKDGVDLSQPFIGGNVGVNAYLLEGLPPPFVQDNGQSVFSFAVVLENQGEADVGPGTDNPEFIVRLEGLNPIQWNLNDESTFIRLIQPLRGARKNFDGTILPGEITTVSFETMSYLPNIRGNTEFVIRADVCYDYKTIVSTKVCLKDDVLENIQDESICSLVGEKFPQNSGAPVQVTSLIQNPLSANKIQVNFVVEHVGFGEFYGREVGETCNPSVHNFNKHKVDVILHPLSDAGLSIQCPRFGNANQGRVKLFQGAPQTISCVIERTRPSLGRIFQDILEIELRYRYGQFIETPIIVQDVSNEPGELI